MKFEAGLAGKKICIPLLVLHFWFDLIENEQFDNVIFIIPLRDIDWISVKCLY